MKPTSSLRGSEGGTSRQQIVERAEAYLNRDTFDTARVGGICRMIGVSERSFRNAFHRVHGMSPKQYMLRISLDRVRDTLRQSGRRTTVTEAALRHGFLELGRFAQRYKAAFGEHPSETLRSATRSAGRTPAVFQPAPLVLSRPPRDRHDRVL